MANSFANLVANLNLNIQNFSTNLRKASSQADKFASNLKGQINGGLVETAKKSKFEFKDVARIVQGIMISKVFYGGLNAIRNCTDAVWEFSQELEYAKIAYSNLFGDTALAEEFINVLEDFAATTPFSFSESEAAAKRLLAYGIQYKNVMYVMQGVLAASSMQNNPQVIESVSRALGQIYTKGRLMNEEMRQLAEAGIPAYEILAEKLGLTQKQLQNLGKEAIPASTAINALVEGMTERFGGVVAQSTTTMKGIISNIKDNATMLASGIFEPMYNGIKTVLGAFGQFLSRLRNIFAVAGTGGLFEALFPPEMHGALRQLAANLKIVILAVARLVASFNGLRKAVTNAAITLINAFAPVLTVVANALAAIINLITSNANAMRVLSAALAAAAAMWVIFKVKALASAVVAGAIALISKALAGLAAMLSFVVAHPFWSLMLLLGGVVVGLSGGFSKLGQSVNNVFKNLTKIGGVDADKLLLPSQEERANDLDKFNQALDGTSDSMDDLADSTGKAAKAAKGLLSFDEVFKLNEPDEGAGSGIVPDMDFDFSALEGLGAGLDPNAFDFDFDLFADDYVTNLIKSLKDKILGAGIGAILGGLLGAAFGGIKGAKLGAAIGAVAGWFWDTVAEKLGISDSAKITVPIATTFGTLIGKLVGHPIIGAAIGALVGWLSSAIYDAIQTGDWSGVALPAGIGLGAAIGALVGHPIIGAAIGALVGWMGGLLIDNWDAITKWFVNAGQAVGKWCDNAIKAYNNWATELEDTINTWLDNSWSAMTDWISNTGQAIGQWCSDAIDAYNNWATEAEITINNWINNTLSSMLQWVSDTGSAIGQWCSDAIDAYNNWATKVETTINTWLSNTWNSITSWLNNTWNSITSWLNNTANNIASWFTTLLNTTKTGLNNIWIKVTTWLTDLWKDIWENLTNIGRKIGNWWDNLWKGKSASVDVSASGATVTGGHATGGVFNREHIARFAEGDKAEAIIPLENASAMQPFVDAVSNGITASLMPLVANISGGQNQLQPLYVGTLVADERSLRELERKMQIIRMQEDKRRGY